MDGARDCVPRTDCVRRSENDVSPQQMLSCGAAMVTLFEVHAQVLSHLRKLPWLINTSSLRRAMRHGRVHRVR